jgi:hypothetical protein
LNLRRFIDNYADLDAQLLQSDTEALATLDHLLDVETTLANIKYEATEEKSASAARAEPAGPKPTP